MYDLFFVSYEEPNAELNWQDLKKRFPHAKRIHGIKGIANAHKACASASYTSMFFTVDGDTAIDGSWDFSYLPPAWDRQYLHLWHSRNPVNGLCYGYGSVKLWPRTRVLEYKGSWLDFTTCVGNIKIMDGIVSVTNFNSSEFEAWKSAFRECVKLHNNLRTDPADSESRMRLDAWSSVALDVPFARWCLCGAEDARLWQADRVSLEELLVINDFSWLRSRWLETHGRHLKSEER